MEVAAMVTQKEAVDSIAVTYITTTLAAIGKTKKRASSGVEKGMRYGRGMSGLDERSRTAARNSSAADEAEKKLSTHRMALKSSPMSTPMMSSCSRIAFVGVCSRGWRRANTAGARPSSAIPSSWYESSISSAQKRPQLPSVAETSTHMASQWPPTSPATCVIEPSCQQRQSGSTAAAAPSVSKYPSIMITTASPSARGSVRCGLPISPAKVEAESKPETFQ
mmetsp:Transcript_59704/g.129419  ORF Transcript_59704/g.129419 Transcript_59704/m.129419 type:complete len:222 (-) Transcript_59704:337-1002(-)